MSSAEPTITHAERELAQCFQSASPPWELYVRPFLNSLRPHLVLINPQVGIAVFEVCEWNPDVTGFNWEAVDGSGRLLLRADDGAILDNPFERVIEHKNNILDLYCPRLGVRACEEPKAAAVVTAGVIMAKVSTGRASLKSRSAI